MDGVGAADAKEARLTAYGKLRGRASSLNTLLFAAAFHRTHLPGEYRHIPARPLTPRQAGSESSDTRDVDIGAHIYTKLDIHSRVELTVLALQHG